MRERRRLEEAIGATRAIEQRAGRHGRADRNGRGRGRRGAGRRRGRRARRARRAGRARQGRGAARRRGRRQRHLYRGQCRRRRHREPGLGRDAAAHVHALGRAARHEGRAGRPSFGRAGRDQVGDPADQGRERLWLCQDRERRPPAGPDQPLRQLGAAPHQLRLASGSIRWSTTISTSRSTRATSGSTPTARRAPAGSTSTPPTARSGSPICRPGSSSPARTSARSTRTGPRR